MTDKGGAWFGRRKDDCDDDPNPLKLGIPKNPISKLGDVWILGRHKLMCGDSTDRMSVHNFLDGVVPLLMVTDPPYGVKYDPDWRNRAKRPDGTLYGASALAQVSNDDRADWREVWTIFGGDVIYQWAPPGAHLMVHAAAIEGAGFEIRAILIWNKNLAPIGRGHYHVRHEPCIYAVRKGARANWCGDRKQTTVWDIAKPQKSETGHSTQKPLECMERPIRNHEGDVYDPFVGSGTTIIAAERQKRTCYAMEISPGFVDLAVRRWEMYTGKKAMIQDA